MYDILIFLEAAMELENNIHWTIIGQG